MKRLILTLLFALATAVPARAQAVLTPADFTVQCSATLAQNGVETPANRGLTSRVVNGQVRLLTLAGSRLQEVAAPDCGQTASTVLRSWDLSSLGFTIDTNGLWWEEAKQRLWVTAGHDYDNFGPQAQVWTVKLNDNGSIASSHRVYLQNVPERMADGGCQPSPRPALGPYVCGWGGYHSQWTSGAALGPTMFALTVDPDSVADGATVPTRAILNFQPARGVRVTTDNINYFDGGDLRQNGTTATKPTSPPAAGAQYVTGFFSFGDKYLNTGLMIDMGTKRGFLMIASLMKGVGWYCNSDLCFEGREYEWHIWDTAALGSNLLQRPTSMAPFVLPSRGNEFMTGNTQMQNVAGATFAPSNGRIYAVNCGGGQSYQNSCLLRIVTVAGGTAPAPTPTPTPTPTPDPVPVPTPAPVPAPTPIVFSLTVDKTAIALGQSYTLTVALDSNEHNVKLDGQAVSAGTFTKTPTVAGTMTHTLTATDAAGMARPPQTVSVVVSPQPVPAPVPVPTPTPTPTPVPTPAPVSLTGVVQSVTQVCTTSGSWWNRKTTCTNERVISIKVPSDPGLSTGQSVTITK